MQFFNSSKIFILLVLGLIVLGCSDNSKGQIRITSETEDAIIYIDGDKKGMTGDGYTTIIIEEGDHEVRIYKEKDEEWYYEGIKKVYVGESSSVKIEIYTDKKPTKSRLERLKKEKEERVAKEEEYSRKLEEEKQIATRDMLYKLKDFTVRLSDVDTNHYIKLGVTLKLSNKKALTEIDIKNAIIRDSVIRLLSSKLFEDIKTTNGAEKLKNELIKGISMKLNDGVVTNLTFTTYIYQ